jgi:hypothetical protein
MLKDQEDYLLADVVAHDLLAQERRLRRLRCEAERLGYQLVECEQVA